MPALCSNSFSLIDHRSWLFRQKADAYGNALIFAGPGADGIWFAGADVQSDYGANGIIDCGRCFDMNAANYFVCSRSGNAGRHGQPKVAHAAGRINRVSH